MTTQITINPVAMFDGDLERYHRWNVESAARILVRKPEECEITLMVYHIHREILENSGYDTQRLDDGDNELVRLVERGVNARLN